MKSRLDQLEATLQAIIESSIDLLPSSLRQKTLAQRLVNALRTSIQVETSNSPVQPLELVIHLNPEELVNWKNNQDFLDSLMWAVQSAIADSSPELSAFPTIQLDSDPALPFGEFQIETNINTNEITETAVLAVPKKENEVSGRESYPENAFLILDQSNTIPLRQTVINIGRRLNNHIIIDDPRVSRNHAQLRAIRGQYVLFDLNSTGGTFVNGGRITQYTLKPGDVISLAGVPIIYGEEYKSSLSETGEYVPEP